LGRVPNVSIKISDLVVHDHHWTLERLAEVVIHCLECFSVARRCQRLPGRGAPDEVYDAFKAITSQLSADEQRALFFANAGAPLSAR
jgi:predicted TIM-barrel fold metal-dependent hydrolase